LKQTDGAPFVARHGDGGTAGGGRCSSSPGDALGGG